MTHFSYFNCKDMLRFNNINFDKEIYNYTSGLYFDYLEKWPECYIKAENINGEMVGYLMGKVSY